MERLTKRIDSVVCYVGTHKQYGEDIPAEVSTAGAREILNRLAEYEDRGIDPHEVKLVQETLVTAQRLKKEQYDTLEKYLKAEAEGRLVILPVNIGDDVYYLTSAPSLAAGKPTRVEKSKCRGFYFDNKGIQICLDYDVQGSHGTYGWWGKTIFATCTEAEAALKGITNAD